MSIISWLFLRWVLVYFIHIVSSSNKHYDSRMSYFSIKGLAGKATLEGTVSVVGAKNAALKAIAASILYRNPLSLDNVPEIEDVSRMLEIIKTMGGNVFTNSSGLTLKMAARLGTAKHSA